MFEFEATINQIDNRRCFGSFWRNLNIFENLLESLLIW